MIQIDGKMTEKQVRDLLGVCYHEFCQIVGDGVCGCEVCPYSEFNTDNEENCYEEYINDKLKDIKWRTENETD